MRLFFVGSVSTTIGGEAGGDILFPSKFADISVKATTNQDDEREHVRREKMAIEEIRGLLAEMLEG